MRHFLSSGIVSIARLSLLLGLIFLSLGAPALAEDDAPWSSGDFGSLTFREIGPAIASGRIADFAVDPRNKNHYYVAVCSGGIWETHNAGITFKPIFDHQGSYSIGCMTISPSQPDVVWVGSGESNSQRSVAYGDGVYKSIDGGKSWKNMGLKRSLHIGRIVVHPTDANRVWVAAEGPLWGPGGDRGVYMTSDGGQNWELVLEIDENTGVVDLVADPGNPDVLYAASYQRRRHTWTLINGGPGSGIHKSTDGGKTWTELTNGLPGTDMGRIGLAIAPKAPNTVYAIVEAAKDKGGFFRTQDGGASWSKMSNYVAGSPQYYNEIIPDPINPDRVYSMDTFLKVTEDGGKNWRRLSYASKHVDDHALWINPSDTDHLIAGCDGGVYESFDRGDHWRFFPNLPITQFYRVAIDQDEPFYNVYGGTQDNNTIGGPSRTTYGHGASNREWFFTLGGDGFKPAIDPTNPNIVYSQWQYGNLHRYDKVSGENLDIQPQPELGEILNWNWNSPLLISPHNHERLYYCCQKVFVSEDRGHSWSKISDDLNSGVDRNKLEIMDRVWGVDAVAKNNSTSVYGSIISFNESPVTEGLLFAGTDDGLIHVRQSGQSDWKKYDSFNGVPDGSYVSDLEPSLFDDQVLFATFDNHKRDDFKPYVLKSDNLGKSWKNIAGNLPERGTVYTIAQDHVDPELLFVGTEFGMFFTRNNGENWTQLKAGLPVIACRDLEIQRRENDLVIATFGRGFYILDDYSSLRNLTEESLQENATIYPVKDAWLYNEATPVGSAGRGHQGDSFYLADNPPFGAIFTFRLKDGLQTLKSKRQKADSEKFENNEPVFYPTWDELRAENRENDPAIILTVKDSDGQVVRRINGPTGSGLHRVAWDLRYPDTSSPVNLQRSGPSTPWDDIPAGPYAMPGTFNVTLSQRVLGEETILAGPVEFKTKLLGNNELQTDDFAASLAFQEKAAELNRAVLGASRILRDAGSRLDHIRQAINDTPGLDRSLLDEVDQMDAQLVSLNIVMSGDRVFGRHSEPSTPGLRSRLSRVMWGTRSITTAPTQTQRESLAVATQQFGPLLADLKVLVESDLKSLENKLDAAGAPYTPGRMPVWHE
ncbi:MAG: glycosyl hydrolase [bacterium]|nr:glycosyl hydrolase [bacterium]